MRGDGKTIAEVTAPEISVFSEANDYVFQYAMSAWQQSTDE